MALPMNNDLITSDIFDLLGLTDVPAEEREPMYQKMYDTIEQRVMGRIDDELTDGDASELKQILDTNNRDGFSAFITKHSIDLPRLFTEETLIYKAQMADLVNTIKSHGRDTVATTTSGS